MSAMLRPVRVIERRAETPDIVALALADPEGGTLPDFTPGAHIDVEIPPGLIRQYSLSALPDPRGVYRIGVLRDPASRGGSKALHDLRVGDRLRISPPRNQFALASGPHETLLLAGGIGVTPLLCMADHLHAAGRRFTLHYCARSASHAAFLERLRGGPYADSVALHFDDGDPVQKLDIDTVVAAGKPGTHLYVCGPAGFMAWAIAAAERAGWEPERIHREYFKADVAPAAAGDRPFRVRLAGSGRVFDIPADRSIVAVLRDAGVDVPVSCESGVCGTCLCGVIEGMPEHRDYFLTPAERAAGNQMLPCCSRALSPLLVLDL